MLARALTATLAVIVPLWYGMNAVPAHAQQVTIGNGGSGGFVGDGVSGESNGMGNPGDDGDGGGGGSINAGNSGSVASRGTGGAGSPGGHGVPQVFVPSQLSTGSGNLARITSPLTFPNFNPPGDADGWGAIHDLTACAPMMERVTHVGSEVYSLTFQQPTLPQCSDTSSLTLAAVRDRLAVRLKASAAGAIGDLVSGMNDSATGATSSLDFTLEYAPSDSFSWTIQGLMNGSEVSTKTMLLLSLPADWYMRWSLSGSSLGDGTSSMTQQMEVGYQGHAGPHVSLSLGRQLSGIADYNATTFTLSTSLRDVSAQLDYSVMTTITTAEEAWAVQTSRYTTLKFAFPMLGWLWTVSGKMADANNVIVGLSMGNDNLSMDLSLAPLDFRLSYEAKF